MWRGLGFSSVEDFVSRFWEGFWIGQDPNDLVACARKAIAADPSGGGDVSAALASIQATMAIVAFTGDPMFPPEECIRDAERVPNATFHHVDSDYGHLATFALSGDDVKAIDGALRDLLAKQPAPSIDKQLAPA